MVQRLLVAGVAVVGLEVGTLLPTVEEAWLGVVGRGGGMVVGWFGVAEALGSVVAVVVEYEGPWKFPGASECMLGSASSTLSRLKRLSPLRSAAGVFCGAESSSA
ncbi:hypothetical protein IWZ00DRAFT_518298 [Phyllosticta capitalensis]